MSREQTRRQGVPVVLGGPLDDLPLVLLVQLLQQLLRKPRPYLGDGLEGLVVVIVHGQQEGAVHSRTLAPGSGAALSTRAARTAVQRT